MTERRAIVFVHSGRSWFLPYTLAQALALRSSWTVALLGDGSCHERVLFSPLQKHLSCDAAVRFREVYVHMNRPDRISREYELFCFLRWFGIYDFMTGNGLDEVLYLDSDVLLFNRPEDITKTCNRSRILCGLSIPNQQFEDRAWHASGHASYWTREALGQFCDFALRSFRDRKYLELYREKWERGRRAARIEGVSDMTALYFYWLEAKDGIANFARDVDGAVTDHNINIPLNYEPEEYEMAGAMKRVEFGADGPQLVKRKTGERVRAHALHLQGGAKNFLPRFYRGGPFIGKAAFDSYGLLRRISQRGKRLIGR